MRGRPVKSRIRQNIIEILYFMGKGYGYEIYQVHIQLFPKITLRSIYSQLKKALVLQELDVESVAKEKGEYSWGQEAEKKYYKLGKNAKPILDPRVKSYFEQNSLKPSQETN